MKWAERRKVIKGFPITNPPANFLRNIQERERNSASNIHSTDFMRSPSEARDSYGAVGLWWTKAVKDNAELDPTGFLLKKITPWLGQFVYEVTTRLRASGLREIHTPDSFNDPSGNILLHAASESHIPTHLFPKGSYTRIDDKGVVYGKFGEAAEEIKVWPPIVK